MTGKSWQMQVEATLDVQNGTHIISVEKGIWVQVHDIHGAVSRPHGGVIAHAERMTVPVGQRMINQATI